MLRSCHPVEASQDFVYHVVDRQHYAASLSLQPAPSPCPAIKAHFLDLPLRTLGCWVRVFAAPKAPAPPKSPGELAGAAPNEPPPPPALLAKLKADPAGAKVEVAAAPKPPNRLWPASAAVLAGCGTPSARGAPDAGAACARS